MSDSEEKKPNGGQKSIDYLGNSCFLILNDTEIQLFCYSIKNWKIYV